MAEAYYFSFTGGISGIALALITLYSLPMELIAGSDKAVDPIILISGLLLPLAGGTLAGALSSIRAVRMQTAEILRMAWK